MPKQIQILSGPKQDTVVYTPLVYKGFPMRRSIHEVMHKVTQFPTRKKMDNLAVDSIGFSTSNRRNNMTQGLNVETLENCINRMYKQLM